MYIKFRVIKRGIEVDGVWIELVNDVAAGIFLYRDSLPSHLTPTTPAYQASYDCNMGHVGLCKTWQWNLERERKNVLSVIQLTLCPSQSIFKLSLPFCQHNFPFTAPSFVIDACVHSVCASWTSHVRLYSRWNVQVLYIPRTEGRTYWHRESRQGKLEDESEAESISTSPWAESNKLH